jgi:hypothetical protein
MLNLNELGVNVFIKRAKDIEPFWNNYDLIIWKKNPKGFSDSNGMFRNGWGTAQKITVNNNGTWQLPNKYVRYFK